MSSNARQLAANLPREGGLSSRNMVINGGFDVWQRASSQTTNGYGSADRWYCNLSGATGTYSKVSNTGVMNTVGMVSPNSMSIVTTVADNNTGMWTKIEDVYKASGKTVTLSFWGYNAGSAKNYKYTFSQQHPSTSSIGLTETFVLENGWKYYTFTVDLAYIGDYGHSTASFTLVEITCTDTTTLDVRFTDVQLEVGDTATPFEHEPYGVTLQKCQRYYQDYSTYKYTRSGTVSSSATGNRESIPSFVTTMRTAPTITITSKTDLINIASGYPTLGTITPVGAIADCAVNTGGSHHRYAIYYTCDAEL